MEDWQMKVPLVTGEARKQKIIICEGKDSLATVPAFIFNSGRLCQLRFLHPYSCPAKSCIFLAKCSLLARSAQESLCQRIKQAKVCQNKYSSLKI